MSIDILNDFQRVPRIAYFSMEMALESAIPTYSGGLGVLAGDTMRSAADLQLPLVGVTLASRGGYFRQEIDSRGRQVEHEDPWTLEDHALPLPAKVALAIGDREVWVKAWMYVIAAQGEGKVPVLLLDTDLPENAPNDRTLTRWLYGGDAEYRLRQEMVLGMAGVRLLRALGFTIQRYHLNEGHAALLCLELLREREWPDRRLQGRTAHYNIDEVRALCAFTTHTPVEAGHDKFDYGLVASLLGSDADIELLRELGGRERLNMTQLALNLSEYINGVAESHARQSSRMFPGYEVHAITNGVHPYTWTSESFRHLYASHFPHWCHEPEILTRVDGIADEEIWQAHLQAKRTLLATVLQASGVRMQENVLTLCFARRMTGYKRPDLLFSDLTRLRQIAQRHSLQIVMSGKAHPRDEEGKRLIENLHACIRQLDGAVAGVFLPGYSMDLARVMVAGADVWLNTPLPPLEASGTSGMKAAFNGVPSLSVPDGWWIEGCIEGVTGWAIGPGSGGGAEEDARHLYDKLESSVLPLFYGDRPGWMKVMKGAIGKNAFLFNAHRMMRRYAAEAYLRHVP